MWPAKGAWSYRGICCSVALGLAFFVVINWWEGIYGVFKVFRCWLSQPAGVRKAFLEVPLSLKYFWYWWLFFKSLGEGWRPLKVFRLWRAI